ncbi:TRM11 family SAM-dependent methyltransferase [Kribbella amoyensis]|uniref:TRM11 family SAM-dependent methyltransferase n=1 Tax=Kribbella amoyensis TaxID=996641 RepID=UPI001EE1EFCC|nr:methyltransferase domain-containing protein [Kribbella amoyensis]
MNLTSTADGWQAEIGALHWTRRFGRLERLPWSTNPVVAEVLVRLAKLRPGDHVLDPFCGAGTVLAAVRTRGTRRYGSDHDPRAIDLARRNLGEVQLRLGSARQLAHADRTVHRVIANLPFGKRVGRHADNLTLYPAALHEVARVLTPDGRAVLLTEDKRLLRDAVARTGGLKIVRERVLRFNGATPTAFVLTPTKRRQR